MHIYNKKVTIKKTWYIAVCFAAIVLWNCSPSKDTSTEECFIPVKDILPEKPDYSQTDNWYRILREGTRADVFYILPTCVWDWVNEAGDTVHYANPQNEEQREAMLPSLELAADIFNSHNFYSPTTAKPRWSPG